MHPARIVVGKKEQSMFNSTTVTRIAAEVGVALAFVGIISLFAVGLAGHLDVHPILIGSIETIVACGLVWRSKRFRTAS